MDTEAHPSRGLHGASWILAGLLVIWFCIINLVERRDGFGWPWTVYEPYQYYKDGTEQAPSAWNLTNVIPNALIALAAIYALVFALEYLQRALIRRDLMTVLKLRLPTWCVASATASYLLYLNIRGRDPNWTAAWVHQEYGWPQTFLRSQYPVFKEIWFGHSVWSVENLASNLAVAFSIFLAVVLTSEVLVRRFFPATSDNARAIP